MSVVSEKQSIPTGTLKQVLIKDIKCNTLRYRQDFALDSLVESIKEKGILQPITLATDMQLLAGERRLRAAKLAGLEKIPALIRKIKGEIDAREIELMENLERQDFSWQEKAAGLASLDALYKEKDIDWSGRKTAQLVGGSSANVARQLELSRFMQVLPELANEKTFDDAYKLLKKFHGQVEIDELHKQQQKYIQAVEDNLDPDVVPAGMSRSLAAKLRTADTNYRIQDTFLGLAELKSGGSIHLIECDPPYGINLGAVKGSKDSSDSNVLSYNDVPADKYAVFLGTLAMELYRVAGPDCWLIFWFGPTWHNEVKLSLQGAGWIVDDIPAIWIKPAGQTLQPALYFARCYEPFFLCRKGQPYMNKPGRLNVFDFAPTSAAKKYHPTERPLPLIEELLETLTVPTQVVLVPFLGSGATLRACYKKGLLGLGFDINPEYKPQFLLAVEEDSKTTMEVS